MNARPFFLVSLGLALAAGSVLAAPSSRLFEIYSQRYILDSSGTPIVDLGRLTAEGEFKHSIYMQLPAGAMIPTEAFNRNLLPYSFFPVYDVLGPEALANFRVDASVKVQGVDYFVMAVTDHPKLDVGTVVNLSARGAVAPGGNPLTGGFVVDEHPRRVLLRAIGPTLSRFGVSDPLANPILTVFRQGRQPSLVSNDAWGQQTNAAEIEAAAALVGAFALSRTSQDAAVLIELPPGAYTAQVTSADATGGTALVEIYILP